MTTATYHAPLGDIRVHHLGEEGPRIVIVAGIHGDEGTSIAAARAFVDVLQPRGCRVEIVTAACPEAVLDGSRYVRGSQDLNRSFGRGVVGQSDVKAHAEALLAIIEGSTGDRPALVIDMHESFLRPREDGPTAWAFTRATLAGVPCVDPPPGASGTLGDALADRGITALTLETDRDRLSRAEQMRGYLWMVCAAASARGLDLGVRWSGWRWR